MNIGAPEIIVFLLGQIITAAAIWGGIRSDIKSMHERLSDVKASADEAHKRIDRLYQDEHNRRG